MLPCRLHQPTCLLFAIAARTSAIGVSERADMPENTRKAYTGELRRQAAWLDGRPHTDRLLEEYLDMLYDKGRAPPSAVTAVAAVERAVRELALDGYEIVDPPAGPLAARRLKRFRREGARRRRGQAGALRWDRPTTRATRMPPVARWLGCAPPRKSRRNGRKNGPKRGCAARNSGGKVRLTRVNRRQQLRLHGHHDSLSFQSNVISAFVCKAAPHSSAALADKCPRPRSRRLSPIPTPTRSCPAACWSRRRPPVRRRRVR